nr:hypothetical protein [Tanacetum cinerariifolium]
MSGTPTTAIASSTTKKTEKDRNNSKFYAIDYTIHEILKLGMFKFGNEMGLKEIEILDEVDFWVREKEKVFTKNIKDYFSKLVVDETRGVIVDTNRNFQMLYAFLRILRRRVAEHVGRVSLFLRICQSRGEEVVGGTRTRTRTRTKTGTGTGRVGRVGVITAFE